jgi:hypothetical protein
MSDLYPDSVPAEHEHGDHTHDHAYGMGDHRHAVEDPDGVILHDYWLECDHKAEVPGPHGATSGRAWCPVCMESRAVVEASFYGADPVLAERVLGDGDRSCDTCGKVERDGGDYSPFDWIHGSCEDCDPKIVFQQEPERDIPWTLYPRYEDWQYEVANGDTLRGYREWIFDCNTCGGTGRWESTTEDEPSGKAVDLGPCPECGPVTS